MKYYLDRFNDPQVKQEFQDKIGGRFAPFLLLNDIQQLVDEFNEKLEEKANEVLGKQRRIKKPWVDNEVLSLCDQRRNLKSRKLVVKKI